MAFSANLIRSMMPTSLDGKSYKSTPQTNIWIVIHNTAGGTAKSNTSYFHSGAEGKYTCTHYVVDDKEIYQLLEDNWKGTHCGKEGRYWTDNPIDATDCNNSNSIGIEVADGSSVNHLQAIENVIELTRYLMKQYNIDVNHVIRHGDTQNKPCPATIMELGKWPYIKEQLTERTQGNVPLPDFNNFTNVPMNGYDPGVPNTGAPGSGTPGYSPTAGQVLHNAIISGNTITTVGTDHTTYGQYSSAYGYLTYYYGLLFPLDIVPNQDHRYNIANMDKVTGACLIFLPPYNVCTLEQKETHFKQWDWDRKYHYVIDPGYNVDDNPDDDIPDVSNAKPVSEMNNPSDTDEDNNENNNDEENDNDEENNEENENQDTNNDDQNQNENEERLIQPRVPLGPDDDDDTTDDDDDSTETDTNKFTEEDFKNASFIGDSLTVGLGNAVGDINIFATVGQTVGKGRVEHAQNVISKGSKIVVISYGTNDAGYKDTSGFITNYKNLINDIKTGIPGVTVFINKIFPGDASKATSDGYKTAIANIPAHNEALNQICSETGAILLDCTTIPNLQTYYTDGIHFTSEFYKLWYEDMKTKILNSTSSTPTTPTNPGSGPAPVEDKSIVITGGFKEETSRLLQCYGLMDNDKITYINRAMFKNKPTAHTIMIACFIPTADELKETNTTFAQVEKNIINSVSKILWANGLGAQDLWREFDMNRAPSPALYLDRDDWKDLLTEIDKQVVWRNKKFGTVSTKYEPYIATIPDQTIHSGIGTYPGSGSNPGGGTPPDIGNISDVAKAVWTFFTGAGFTPECTAGIMGNLQQESGMDPTRYQSGGGPGRGICQWTVSEERFKGMQAHAQSKGKDWTDLQSQLEWLNMELQGKDPTTLSYLKKYVGGYEQFKALTDVRQACKVFEDSFERAGKPMMEKRYAYAEQFYNQFKGTTAPTPDDEIDDSPEGTPEEAMYSMRARTVQPRAATFSWPTPGITKVSSKFGPRVPPCPGASSNHGGIDISAPMNTDVCATAAGTVTLAKFHKEAGNYMVIDHGNGWGSRYLHLNNFIAKVGDQVAANQVIAKSGNTGIGTGAHLHFEIHDQFPAGGTSGHKVDPLLHVNPGETVGSPAPPSSSTPGGSTPGGSTPGGYTPGNGTVGPLVNSIFGEIENPGPAKDLPYTGNSMGGLEHDDWGGKMSYYLGDPEDSSAEKPEIGIVITDVEYTTFCDTYFKGERYNPDGTIDLVTNFNQFWELMDLYAGEQEPYDKGLVTAKDAGIDPNDRLGTMTTNFTTDNENSFHFNVLESGPGTADHCAKAADELNYIVVPKDLKVEPIYPDLIIPPQYNTSGHDTMSENTIPLCMIETLEDSTAFTKQLSFDYDLLKDITKSSDPRLGPINFMDPYPTDDKIEELEQHYPKVFIDEIESQIYSCNHPGCPIAQPMAKNFAMLSDALMNQSKRVEKRLVRIENILSTFMRNQARLSSRININCVYYGGQSTLAGKYKCIRCMHDDRINDGAIVTLDQCLNCTRYEPILGQVYQILDESGFNGSVILDDMQMSYSDLTTFKKQNVQIERSPRYDFVEVNSDSVGFKPAQTRIEMWKEANKQAYLANKPTEVIDNVTTEDRGEDTGISQSQYSKTTTTTNTTTTTINGVTSTDTTTDTTTETSKEEIAVIDPVIEAAEEVNYIFRMNWNETYFNSQQPDTKPYPTEGIIMRFKKQSGDLSYAEEINELDPELDKDAIEDLQRAMKIANGEWTETRENAETVQQNKYSSEKFYFKGFAEIKAFDPSSIGLPGPGYSTPGTQLPGNVVASQCRNKIVEMAKLWLQDCQEGKAWYNTPSPRTVDNTQPQYSGGKKVTDCTGLVSCCYMHAGLKSMYDKSASGGSMIAEILNNGGEMWLMDTAGIQKALPGDILVRTKGSATVTQADMSRNVPIEHAMVYIGNDAIIHASGKSRGIVQDALSSKKASCNFFIRPGDLIEADKQAAQNPGSGGGVDETPGTINGKNYVAKVSGAVCTSYSDTGAGASGMGCEYNKTCASHNIPYGTKVYIPGVQSITGGDAIFTVTDTGGYQMMGLLSIEI
jgi:murein DD-endopeptidase MepM/ murein hydrolase activator NlpD/lysophospholipase L1-like esterase/cell wall-associated NlpC family hydrolase